MTDALGQFNAGLWWIVFLVLLLIAPYLFVYVLWRALKDLRRIAVGIEALTKWASVFHDDFRTGARPLPSPAQPPAQAEQPSPPAPSGPASSGGSVPLSAFGR